MAQKELPKSLNEAVGSTCSFDDIKIYDSWGSEIVIITINNIPKITSPGSDKTFNTDDNLLYEL